MRENVLMRALYGELFTAKRGLKYRMVNAERQAESLAFFRFWRGIGGFGVGVRAGRGLWVLHRFGRLRHVLVTVWPKALWFSLWGVQEG